MANTNDLINLKAALSEAIKTSKRLDRCHASYISKTQDGFSRAATTTYNANAASLATSLKSELEMVLIKSLINRFVSF